MFESLFSRKGWSLEKLNALVNVAEAGGIAAATAHHLSPEKRKNQEGLISRQLKELGAFFGAELIERHGRGIRLTEFGQEVARQARAHFQTLDDLKSRAARRPMQISIGAGDSLLHWLVIPRMAEIQRRTGDAVIALCDLRTHEVQRRLADLSLDFGLLRGDAVRQPVKSEPLGELRYALFVPKGLAGDSRKAPPAEEALAGLPIATQGGNTLFQSTLNDTLEEAGLPMNVRLYCETFPEVEAALRTGHYAGVLPTGFPGQFSSDAFWRVELPLLNSAKRRIHLAWNPRLINARKGLPEALAALRDRLRF